MLETIREFALARLAEDEGKEVFRRHAVFFLGLAEAGRPDLVRPASESWLIRLEAEHDHLRAALTANRVLFPYFIALLASRARELGDIHAGLVAIAEAQEMADRTEDHFWDSELLRLRGSCCWQSREFRRRPRDVSRGALDVARRQGARSLELRAATSLARHLGDEKSLRLLHELYQWFYEGFDTADLHEARTLLDR